MTETTTEIATTTEDITVAGLTLTLTMPVSAEDLISQEEFDVDERLPYWAELWPSGRVLAEWVAGQDLDGARVLELGAGLALPSLVAAARGARVTVTDWYRPALDFTRENARTAGVTADTALVDWRDPPPSLCEPPGFDLVIAADVLYEPRNAAPLAALVPRVCAPSGSVVIADPRRPDARAFLDTMAATGWRVRTDTIEYSGRRDETGSRIHLHHLSPGG